MKSFLAVLFLFVTASAVPAEPEKKFPEIFPSAIRLRFTGTTTSKDVKDWVLPGGKAVPGNIFIFKVSVGMDSMGMSPQVTVEYAVSDCPPEVTAAACTLSWDFKARMPNPAVGGMDVWSSSDWSENTSTNGEKVIRNIVINDPAAMGMGHPVEIRFRYAKASASQMPDPSKLLCKVESVSGNQKDLETTKPPASKDKIVLNLKSPSIDTLVFNTGTAGEPYVHLPYRLKRRPVSDSGRVVMGYSATEMVSGMEQRNVAVLQMGAASMNMEPGGGGGAMPGMDMGAYSVSLVKTWQIQGLVGAGLINMSCALEETETKP